MYTRCPKCETTFSITPQQLRERDGLVRCGQCHKVFYAEETLSFDKSMTSNPGEPATDTGPQRRKPFSQSKLVKTTAEELLVIKQKLLGRKVGDRTRPFFWASGILLLSLLLVIQYGFFDRDALARHPHIGKYVIKACEVTDCVIRPQQDIGLIELVDTKVSPHPVYENALRVRATLINRAGFGQPFPLMEINLTNRQGEVNSRRTFAPEDYLGKKYLTAKLMPRNIAVKALLDITNPGKKTEGYEIRLLSE